MSKKQERQLVFEGWRRNVSAREKHEADVSRKPVDPDEALSPIPSKKKKGFCIKLKGPHDFSILKKHVDTDFGWSWDEYECRACGKKDLKDV